MVITKKLVSCAISILYTLLCSNQINNAMENTPAPLSPESGFLCEFCIKNGIRQNAVRTLEDRWEESNNNKKIFKLCFRCVCDKVKNDNPETTVDANGNCVCMKCKKDDLIYKFGFCGKCKKAILCEDCFKYYISKDFSKSFEFDFKCPECRYDLKISEEGKGIARVSVAIPEIFDDVKREFISKNPNDNDTLKALEITKSMMSNILDVFKSGCDSISETCDFFRYKVESIKK